MIDLGIYKIDLSQHKAVKIYNDVVGKISYWLALAMFFSLCAPLYFLKIVMVVWMSFWLLEYRYLNIKNICIDKTLLSIGCIIVLYLLELLSLSWSVDTHETGLVLSRQIYFLVVAPVLVFGVNDNYKPKNMIYAMIVGALFFSVLYYFTIYCSASYNMMYEDDRNNWQKVELWKLSERIMVFKHHTYLSLSLLLSAIGVPFIRKNMERIEGRWESYVLNSLVLLAIVLSIYVCGARATVLTLPILVFAALAFKFRRHLWKIVLLGAISVGLSVAVILKYHFHSDTTIEVVSGTVEKGSDTRFMIWQCLPEVVSGQSFLGCGAGTSRIRMVEYYQKYDMPQLFLDRGYGTHNQYFAVFLDLGLIGVAIYLSWLFFMHRYHIADRTRLFALLVSISFAIHFFFENMTDKVGGIVIVCIMFLLLNWMHRCDKRGIEW